MILFVDQAVTYKELIEIYRWLFVASLRKVAVVTCALDLGIYEGFYEQLSFWQEEIEVFENDHNLPPAPPLLYKEAFLDEHSDLQQIHDMNVQQVALFESLFDAVNKAILLSFSSKRTLKEYCEARIAINKSINRILNFESFSKFQKAFNQLDWSEKKSIRESYPEIVVERN